MQYWRENKLCLYVGYNREQTKYGTNLFSLRESSKHSYSTHPQHVLRYIDSSHINGRKVKITILRICWVFHITETCWRGIWLNLIIHCSMLKTWSHCSPTYKTGIDFQSLVFRKALRKAVLLWPGCQMWHWFNRRLPQQRAMYINGAIYTYNAYSLTISLRNILLLHMVSHMYIYISIHIIYITYELYCTYRW